MTTLQPGALARGDAAAYVGLSVTTFEREVRAGRAPKPRQVAGRRVVWLRVELDEFLGSLPVSEQLPPENTGAPKPRAAKVAANDPLMPPTVPAGRKAA